MEQKFPKYTPVKHKREGYKGWIHETTRMKELFTGNKDCDWQYTIRLAEDGIMRVAPEEDLEINTDSSSFPPFIEDNIDSESGFQLETKLRALGYQITDIHWRERWEILINVAIPILGIEEVTRTILNRIYQTLKSGSEMIEKRKYALTEWRRDVEMLLDRFNESKELKNSNLLQYIHNIQSKLDSIGIVHEDSVKNNST